MATYEVILSPAAQRAVLGLRSEKERAGLADALRQELDRGPNVDKEYRFPVTIRGETRTYTATPLSFGAYTAVHRPMTAEERRKLRREQGHAGRRGFYVQDILSPESWISSRHPFPL